MKALPSHAPSLLVDIDRRLRCRGDREIGQQMSTRPASRTIAAGNQGKVKSGLRSVVWADNSTGLILVMSGNLDRRLQRSSIRISAQFMSISCLGTDRA